uniref:Structural maintenance of chromosomes protein 5 n=1 Tax=Oryza punctata TaxID=4537 RepID=A0A0E0L6N3_ORYPU
MASSRAAKRPKRGDDDYVPGNIVEIELCNFMTYDHLTCRPGPRLNLVVGPNGSGKSSLVCAIALALAADPAILGRAASVAAFVKRGEDSGHVKISLRGNTPDHKLCITRKIDTNNKSEWQLDGTTVPKKEVIDLIKKFNIQVNNLTQFLPQDRVCEFAKLTPIQLLEETEKAVGDPNLPVQHRQLIDRSKDLKILQVAVKQKEKTLNNLKALNAELEKDVERVRQRDRLLKKKKLPWLKYDMKKKEYKEAQEKEKTEKKKMEEVAKIWEDSKGPVEYIQLTEEIARLTCDINELKRKKTDMESHLVRERENLRNCSDRLKQMENKNHKLLQALRYSGAEKINEAYNWVQDNRHMFRAEVYGPVLLESFITQDASDRDLLVRQMKQYDIPVLNYMGDKGIRREPFNITLEMQQVGIYSRLDQVFEAPPAVKDVLISQANLDRSYIGTDETHNRADDVPKLGISDFWTPDNHYRWSRSRYGGHLSAFVDAINPSRLFMCNLDVIDTERLRSQKDKHIKDIEGMDEDLKKLLKEQRQLEDEAAKIRRKKEEITDTMMFEKKRQEETRRRVDIKRRMLETIYKEEDMELSKRKFVDQVAKLNDQRYELVLKLKDLLIEAVALKWSCTQKNMASIELDTKIWEMEKDVKKLEKDAVEAAKEYENCKRKTQEHKQQLSNAKQHAESIAMITEDLAKKFLEMPTTIEELDCAIQDTESEANSMLFLNQNVLLEYQNRQREIESISGKLEDDKGECQKCYSDIEATKGKWLPTLRTLISKINSTFSRNFQEMAVAGEVSLDEHGLDFEQYGILIKVKFRSVAGVERSSPIWRGMDPINERKMFQQLVRAASQPNTPQCFLLTPKLLPDLEYSDACSILNIMNGPWIEKPAKAWSTGDCWRTVMSLLADP